MFRHAVAAASAALVIAASLTACAADEPDPVVAASRVTFSDVVDETASTDFTIGSTATGVTDESGSYLTIDINVSNANQIKINPAAAIVYPDGRETLCQEEDVRRLPSLEETTTTWDLPCAGSLQDDAAGAVVTVTDEYH